MNRVFGLFFCALLLTGNSLLNAQSFIGYSNGNVVRKNGVRFGNGTTQGMAIRIPAEKAGMLKGCKITGVKTAFATTQVSDLKIFVTKDLNAEPLYCEDVSGATTSWKDFRFSNPVTIDGDEFYVGYTFSVLETYRPLLFDESTDFGHQIAWAYNGGIWEDITGRGYGAPNIRVNLESAPEFSDLIIKPVDASGYYKEGNSYSFGGQIFNFGTRSVTSFDISCQLGDGEPVVTEVRNVRLASGETYDFRLPEYNAGESGKLPFKISVSNINGTEDDDATDNLSVADTYIYPSWVQKKVLIENFTGQTCGNCPTGHANMKAALAGIEDEFIQVTHHSGYNPDAFTMNEDISYTWFYGGRTFAPAAMFNRAPFADGLASVVFATTDTRSLASAVKAFREEPPYVSLQLLNSFDEATREGDITVNVHTFVVPSDARHMLNLFLVQDGLAGYQSGAGSAYVHDHVFRGSLTGDWGVVVDLIEGRTTSKTFHYVLPEKIQSSYEGKTEFEAVPANMSLVAFVSNAAASPLQCVVYNSASIGLTGTSTGISGASDTPSARLVINGRDLSVTGTGAAEVYTPAGQLVRRIVANGSERMASGVYVVRIVNADGTVTARKVVLK